jgi:uncharacterized radical SAM superfamily Fe-S cluster-containing enzyme
VVEGCPHDCGICPEHKQHSCLGIIEVNTGCNLACPICFADSGTGHQADGFSLSLDQVEEMLDAFVVAEGEPEAIQLSGGEPSNRQSPPGCSACSTIATRAPTRAAYSEAISPAVPPPRTTRS